MARYRIAYLPGDGVGSEVMAAARLVLDQIELDAEYLPGDIGWEFWCREGDPLPARTIEMLGNTDCALFGCVTSKTRDLAEKELVPQLQDKGFVYRSPVVRIRQLLDLYICLRPCKAYPGNPLNIRDNIEIVVFRENTEDLYTGIEFTGVPAQMRSLPGMDRIPADAAISLKVNTRQCSERIIRSAFEFARAQSLYRVTCVHKASVLRVSDGLFLDVAQEIAREYADVEFDAMNVDACCMALVRKPQEFKVIVAPNFYGDIVSDISAELVGGLGFGCTGNIGRNYALFEPSHGSAPRYAGQNRVNPIATILAAKMMLNWLGERGKAVALQNAVSAVIADGKVRTADMGGKASTTEMAEAIADRL
ncbi:MAG TPA: isocitrate/isopropylmalate dehydrogenase family protein [Phycisphaerae bacterium]|nr:isocitrate/isopropylmalate dehydrogenase family protein [Phycisphaerae bacterium]